jgi:hypothetical protein
MTFGSGDFRVGHPREHVVVFARLRVDAVAVAQIARHHVVALSVPYRQSLDAAIVDLNKLCANDLSRELSEFYALKLRGSGVG